MELQAFLRLVGAVALLLATPTQAAAPPPAPTSLLIRYRVVSTDSFTEITSILDAFIFRDGLVIEHLSNDTGGCSYVRASAQAEKLARLKTVLGRNRVDLQQGNCTSEPPGDSTVERQVTWFGRGRRQHSYRYGFGDSFGELCSFELREIDLVITEAIGTAIDRQTAQTCP